MSVMANPMVEQIDEIFAFCLFIEDSDPESQRTIGQGVFAPADFDGIRLNSRKQEIRALIQELPEYTDPDINRINFSAACARLHLHDEVDQHCEIEKLIQLKTAAQLWEFGQLQPLDRDLDPNELNDVYFVRL